MVCDGVDVVALQSVGATTVHAGAPGEVGGGSEVERRLQLRLQMAPEMGDRVDIDPVVQRGLDEGIVSEVLRHGDGDRAGAQCTADLSHVRVTAPVRKEIADDDEVCTIGPAGCARP